jgi:hypothetical protein
LHVLTRLFLRGLALLVVLELAGSRLGGRHPRGFVR